MNHHNMCLYASNLYGWTMSQKLPVNDFKWNKNAFKFNEHFIKNYDKNFLKQPLNILRGFQFFIVIYHFYLKESRLKNSKSLYTICMIKNLYYSLRNFKTSIKSWLVF